MNRNIIQTAALGLGGALLLGAVFAVAGCGEKSAADAVDANQAFANAPAEVKQVWDQALTAEKTNDYATALDSLARLNKLNLTKSQRLALAKERAEFGQRLMQAPANHETGAAQTAPQNSTPR